jgi:carbazole 1,9a-dioxygenase terminal dioxygenase component
VKVGIGGAQRTEFEHEFRHRWKRVSLEGFNNQDIMAREALQPFYDVDRNWLEAPRLGRGG